MKERLPVLIVGAGPTGLTLAIALRLHNIPCRIVDRLERGLNTSRAVAVHARTLEVLEPLGISTMLLERGHPVENMTVREHGRLLASVSFRRLPSHYPYILLVPQEITEECLENRLNELGVQVERGTEFVSARGEGDAISVELRRGETREHLKVSYLAGTDGMHSKVREAAGIEFEGQAYEESFVLADVNMNWPYGNTEGSVLFGRDGLALVVPLPHGRYRLVATLADAPPNPDRETMQAILDARGPAGVKIERVNWSSRFRVHHRLAKSYRRQRFLLLGDAAHVHSPAGGQGMNLGIRDAVALGTAIADGSEDALDRWAATRRARAKRVIRTTDRLTRLGVRKGRAVQFARRIALGAVARLPGFLPAIARNLAGLWDTGDR